MLFTASYCCHGTLTNCSGTEYRGCISNTVDLVNPERYALAIVSKLLIFSKYTSRYVYCDVTLQVVRFLAIQYIVHTACMEYSLRYINYVSQF